MAARGLVSYWGLPIIAGLVWLAMLLGMLLDWIVNEDSRHLPTMSDRATIAFISNIGADLLYPLFIVGCVLTAIFLDLSFIAERWLRHNGRLVPNTSIAEKVLSVLSLLSATVGTVGLVCLSIFKTGSYGRLHGTFLALFIAGYLFSAIFLCCEYQRLGIKNREHQHRKLRISFWIKLIFIIVELGLLIGFAISSKRGSKDAAAVLEWTISFIFTFYAWSFAIDLYPAVHTKSKDARYLKPGKVEMEPTGSTSNESRSNFYQRDADTV